MNGKPSRPVLRGLGASNGARLLDQVPYQDFTFRLSGSIKGESQEKKFPGDWKERKCSLCFPAHLMLRGFGGFCFLAIHFCFRDDAFGILKQDKRRG